MPERAWCKEVGSYLLDCFVLAGPRRLKYTRMRWENACFRILHQGFVVSTVESLVVLVW
jgi:hypothetical protein